MNINSINMFAKILSFFYPINILKKSSEIHKSLELTWNNGQLVLDTQNTNYSYGSLQRILKKGLQHIGFHKIQNFKNILVLGVAGGSVIKTLIKDINFKGKIVGVEIDPEIIAIANQYFGLDKISNLEIIINNAEHFVKNHTNKYDLIIVDIFQDKSMPEFLFENQFMDSIKLMLNKNGFVVFNTMILNNADKKRNLNYVNSFEENEFQVIIIPKLEVFNQLIIIKRK